MSLDLCISGASISKCPWITWVDLLKETLRPERTFDHSCKGAGNQYIMRSAVHSLQESPNSNQKFLAIMLTTFDKYDMWVKGDICKSLQKEKHQPRWIDGQVATDRGFWCTGSHFPLIKQTYLEHFFDLESAASQDLTNLLGLIKYCQESSVKLLVMFDSPVLNYAEKDLNDWSKNQTPLTDRRLKDSVIVGPILKVLEPYILDTQGLIGFCMERDLPWFNTEYGSHPPSSGHYLYFKEKILPWIEKNHPDLVLNSINEDYLLMIERMTKKWTSRGF